MKFTNLFFAPLIFLFIGFNKPLAAQEEETVYTDTVNLSALIIEKIIKNDFSPILAENKRLINSNLLISDIKIIVDSGFYFDMGLQEKRVLNKENLLNLKSYFVGDSIFHIPFSINISNSVLDINIYGMAISNLTITNCKIQSKLIQVQDYNNSKIKKTWISYIPSIRNSSFESLIISTELISEKNNEKVALSIEKSTITLLNIGELKNDLLTVKNSYLRDVLLNNIICQNI